MNQHLSESRILELGLGEAVSLAEKTHLSSCSSCRGLVDEELALSTAIENVGLAALPSGFALRTTARFERALVMRRVIALVSVLSLACGPGGLLLWLAAVNASGILRWFYDFGAATLAVSRAVSSLASTLPVVSAVVLLGMAVTGVVSAYFLSIMVRRVAWVKYSAAVRVQP